MSMCRVFSCVVGRGCLLWPGRSLGKTLLAFALLHSITPRSNLPVIPGISWLPTFAFQSPIMKRTSFWVLVLEGLIGLHRTIQLQLLQHDWLGHRLGLPWYARVQPQQDPGEPSGWTASARETHVGPALIGPSLLGRERERKRERDQTGMCSRVWQLLYFSL